MVKSARRHIFRQFADNKATYPLTFIKRNCDLPSSAGVSPALAKDFLKLGTLESIFDFLFIGKTWQNARFYLILDIYYRGKVG